MVSTFENVAPCGLFAIDRGTSDYPGRIVRPDWHGWNGLAVYKPNGLSFIGYGSLSESMGTLSIHARLVPGSPTAGMNHPYNRAVGYYPSWLSWCEGMVQQTIIPNYHRCSMRALLVENWALSMANLFVFVEILGSPDIGNIERCYPHWLCCFNSKGGLETNSWDIAQTHLRANGRENWLSIKGVMFRLLLCTLWEKVLISNTYRITTY